MIIFGGSPGASVVQSAVLPTLPSTIAATAVESGSDITIDLAALEGTEFQGPKASLTVTIEDDTSLTDSASVLVNGSNDVIFTPSTSAASQVFTVSITDTAGTSNTATVTVDVQAAPGDAFQVLKASKGTFIFDHRFGETSGSTVTDTSGNGITGTYFNSPSLNEPGLVEAASDGRSVRFGSTSYALVDNDASWAVNTFTWTIVAKAAASAIADGAYIIAANEAGQNAGDIGIRFTSDGLGRLRWWGDSPGFSAIESGSAVVEADTPFTLTIRCDTTSMDVIVNGVLLGSLAHTVGMAGNTTSIQYAYRSIGGDAYDITFDESWMYNSALSLSDIQALHEYDPVEEPSSPPPSVAAWNDVQQIDILALTPLDTVNVSNGSQLSAAISSAAPGDHIVLANGTYSGSNTISAQGTEANPIVIRAENFLNAELTGDLTISGSWIIVYGLETRDIIMTEVGANTANNCRVSRCFATGGRSYRMSLGASYCCYDYNSVSGGNGRLMEMRSSSTIGFRNCFVRNHIFGSSGTSSSNPAAVQITALNYTRFNDILETLFAQNLVEDNGYVFAFEVKGSNTSIVQNTFKGNSTAIAMRHGRNHIVSGNWIPDGGISIRGDDALVEGNVNSPQTGSPIVANMGNIPDGSLGEPTTTERPGWTYARRAKFIGNTAPLRLREGTATRPYPSVDSLIEDHTGTISIEGGVTGTVDRRNDPASITVTTAFELTSADVGPNA